jgi:cardiolipin synthase
MWTWLTDPSVLISFLIHDLVVILLVPLVLLSRKEPQAKLAWMFAIILMPLVGALAFLFFGHNRLELRTRRLGLRKRRMLARLSPTLLDSQHPDDVEELTQLVRLIASLNPFPPTIGNLVSVYADMKQNFDDQLRAIESATHHVHIAYYIVQADALGARFRDALAAAARRKVQVRFLYDGVGSMNLTRRFLAELQSAGVETANFLPLSIWTRRWSFNFRNHRKILVVDGRVAFVGGANIGVEYLGQSARGPWIDTHFRIEGPTVRHIQRVFAEDWAFAGGSDLVDPSYFPALEPSDGGAVAQVVSGGPDEEALVWHELYFAAINQASERLRVMTPYLVPSPAVVMALQTAARRGVDVEILTTGVADKWLPRLASRAFYHELLEAGVKVRETTDAFMHSKVMTIDRRWSIGGTANLDNRSMKLNFEIGVIFYDRATTARFDAQFDSLLPGTRQIRHDAWRKRSWRDAVLEALAKLFAPIL